MEDNIFDVPDYIGNLGHKLKGSKIGQEWEEDLVEDSAEEPQKIRVFFELKKLRWLYFLVFLASVILIGRLYQLQMIEGDDLKVAAEENRYRLYPSKSSRGVIYDRHKELLVRNDPSFDVVIVPADLPKEEDERARVFLSIKETLDLSDEDLSNFLAEVDNSAYEAKIMRAGVDRERAILLETLEPNLPGVSVQKNPVRRYLGGHNFSHLLGYIGPITSEEMEDPTRKDYLPRDEIGKGGLEQEFERALRGQYGKEQVEVDSKGKIKKVLAAIDPEAGEDLILTIDRRFQDEVSAILDRGRRAAGSEAAVAVATDPRNGEVLAMVNLPTYDNNMFIEGFSDEDYQNLLNDEGKPLIFRAVNGNYPPGSVIKPVMAIAGLEEGVINKDTVVVDTGAIEVPNKYNPDIVYRFVSWDLGGLGPMNIFSAIAKSSDIYFYYVGGGFEDFQGLGYERIADYYQKFGLGSPVGIDLAAEGAGLIPSPEWKEEVKNEAWVLGDTYHISIGQGDLLVTPLQVANFTATIANGGTFYRPRVVNKTVNTAEGSISELKPEVIRENFVSRDNVEIVRRAMRETVLSGSATQLKTLPIEAAGKTGTAQYANNTKSHAWFTCFAPYDDPEIALTVLVEGGGEGHDVAVPIAKDILEWYFSQDRQEN